MRAPGWGYGIDAGSEGPFSRFFPFSRSSVQDVFDRDEESCTELAGWPIQPEYGTFRDENGTHYYSVKDSSLDEDWIHPSELSGK